MIPADQIRDADPVGGPPLPCFRRDLDVVSDESNGCRLRDSRTGREFKLGQWERIVVSLLDGNRRADEVCRDLALLHGIRCDAALLHRFVAQLQGAGLLGDGGAVRPARVERRGMLYMVRLFRPHEWAGRTTARLRWLAHPLVLVAAGVLVAGATAVTITNASDMGAHIARVWTTSAMAAAVVTTILAGIVHESAHALTASAFGARLVSAGVGAYYFRPCLFCEVVGIDSLPRSRRLVVSGAGVSVDLLQASACAVAWRFATPGFVADTLLLTASLLAVRVVFNLNPLLKLDGYYLLVDWLDRRDLREAAFRALGDRVRALAPGPRRATRASPEPLRPGDAVYAVLAVAYLVAAAVAIVATLGDWLRNTAEGAEVILATIVVLALAMLTDATLLRRARRSPRQAPVMGGRV